MTPIVTYKPGRRRDAPDNPELEAPATILTAGVKRAGYPEAETSNIERRTKNRVSHKQITKHRPTLRFPLVSQANGK